MGGAWRDASIRTPGGSFCQLRPSAWAIVGDQGVADTRVFADTGRIPRARKTAPRLRTMWLYDIVTIPLGGQRARISLARDLAFHCPCPGDRNGSLKWPEQAHWVRNANMPYLSLQIFDSPRPDRQFLDLLCRVNLLPQCRDPQTVPGTPEAPVI